MWICQKCGEQMGDAVDACWKCGITKDGTADSSSNDLQIPDAEHREVVSEAYAALGSQVPERSISGSEMAGIAVLYILIVLPFIVLPPLYLLWQSCGVSVAAVYFLLFVLAWRLCGGVAACCAAWSSIFTLAVYHNGPTGLYLVPGIMTVLFLVYGYSDKRKQLTAMNRSRHQKRKTNDGEVRI